MPCWHVGPCGVVCDGYTANPQPQPAAPTFVPVVLPYSPIPAPYRTAEEYADLLQSHYSLYCKIEALQEELRKKDLQNSELLASLKEVVADCTWELSYDIVGRAKALIERVDGKTEKREGL